MGAEVKSMEVKKTNSHTTVDQPVAKKKVQDFVTDLKSEIFKVEWTSKEELITYSKIVVITTFIFGMSIYLMDLLIQGTLSGLHTIIRLIAG